MATSKTSTLTFRIQPALKEALRVVAEQEHRSIANMVEVMIRDYCGRVCRSKVPRRRPWPSTRYASASSSNPSGKWKPFFLC